MGRPDRPLDPATGPLTAFAADLRRLRRDAGNPTYRVLAEKAHYSLTTLSDAAGGRKLPTLPVTLALVKALGGDEQMWRTRWRHVADQLRAAAGPDDPSLSDGGGGATTPVLTSPPLIGAANPLVPESPPHDGTPHDTASPADAPADDVSPDGGRGDERRRPVEPHARHHWWFAAAAVFVAAAGITAGAALVPAPPPGTVARPVDPP